MSDTFKLLHQVRQACSVVTGSTENHEYATILSAADLLLNELALQQSPAFYIDYIARGKTILAEGQGLLEQLGLHHDAGPLRSDLSEEMRDEVFDAEIRKLHDNLVAIVQALDENRSAEEKEFLVRLSDWENTLYTHRLEQVPLVSVGKAEPITRDKVQAYLEFKFPQWTNLRVTGFNALYGGLSKKTILVETEDEVNGVQSVVFRVEQPVKLLCYDGGDVSREYYMIKLMHRAGIPVAEPLWLEQDERHLGGAFIVSVKSPGQVMGDSLGSKDGLSGEAVEDMLNRMYQLHKVVIDPEDEWAVKSHLREWLPHKTITDTTRYWVDVFIPNEIERTGIRLTPDLVRCMKWLQGNVPVCDEPPVVVHMDYAFNNLLFDGQRVSAILDWETSRLGDPVDEIIWTQNCLEKLIPMPEFLERYKAATGREISQYRVAYSWVVKIALTLVGSLRALQSLNEESSASIDFSFLAYKYMPMLCTRINALIANAEAQKGG